LGGDIFIQSGAIVTIDGGSLSGGAVGSGSGATDGAAYGTGIFLQGDQNLTLAPATDQTVTVADTIADQSGSGGTGNNAGSGSLVIDGSGTVDLSGANTFVGGTTLEGGTLLLSAAHAAGSGAIVFQNDPTLAFAIANVPTNTIDGFSPGDTIDITDLTTTATHATLDTSDNELSIPYTSGGGGTLTLQLDPGGDYTNDVFDLAAATTPSTGTVLTLQATCFCRGTLILTDRGDIAVENLRIGDTVITYFGDLRPIRWIGRRGYSGVFATGKSGILPVRIARNALDDGVPQRDLLVSPQHAMLLDGLLIPAVALLNGRSIVQVETVDLLEYYHVELDSHDVILAEGAPSESFVDDASRTMFENAAEYLILYPDTLLKPVRYCAPRVEDGDAIESLRHRLTARADSAPPSVAHMDRMDIAESLIAHGYLDSASRTKVRGWAWSPDHPDASLVLDVLDNGEVIARVLANRYRADLRAAGIGGGRHGFELTIPNGLSPLTRHVITVRVSNCGTMLENGKATIEPVTRFDDGLAIVVADALAALNGPVEQDRVLSFLAAQMDRLLQHRANTEAQRHARHAHLLFRRRWGPDAAEADPSIFSNPGLRALFIDEEVPVVDRDAGSQAVMSHMLAFRKLGYQVSFVAAQQFSEDGTPAGTGDGIAALERDAITCCRLPAYASVEEVLRRQAGCFDLIYLHRLSNAMKYLALARQYCPHARVLYSVADLHHLRLERQARIEERSDLLAESHRVRLMECMVALSADAVLTHSVYEAMLLRKVVPGANVHVVPWVIHCDQIMADDNQWDDQQQNGVAFIANYAHEPNVDAAHFLAGTIMPLVWQRDPTITCLLVGSRMPETIHRLARPGPSMALLALGHLPDLCPLFDRIRLTVAPLRYGAGIKGKVLASFAAGVPCVMSAIAAEGIGLPPILSACVSNSPAEIAGLIVQLHADAAARRAAGRAGQALIETGFSASRVVTKLKAAIDSLNCSAMLAEGPTKRAVAEQISIGSTTIVPGPHDARKYVTCQSLTQRRAHQNL
jgi:autotransporter-associated beta strand protein